MPEDMGHFRRNLEKRRFRLISGLVAPGNKPAQHYRRAQSSLSGVVTDELQSNVTPRVLDVGCGSGWLSEMLGKRGFSVTALDMGLDSIRRAAERVKGNTGDVSFVLGDIYRLPFSDGRFDAVAASEVLEHLDRPQEALSEIVRVVKPGGCIVVSTPYRERIEETLCVHCNRKTPINAHLHSFDEIIIEDMFKAAGCVIQKRVTFVNRSAERFGLAGFTYFLPYMVWRFFDAVACRLIRRESFMAVKAVRVG